MTSSHRRAYVDWARGIAVLLMIEAHTADAWTRLSPAVRDLRLSEGTVKVHVSAILKALHVHSRTEAIAALARRGISVDTLAASRASAASALR